MNNTAKLTDNSVLYAPVTVTKSKGTKVLVLRAKSLAFCALSAERTAELVANATGFSRPFTHSDDSGVMYQ